VDLKILFAGGEDQERTIIRLMFELVVIEVSERGRSRLQSDRYLPRPIQPPTDWSLASKIYAGLCFHSTYPFFNLVNYGAVGRYMGNIIWPLLCTP
jgi:hypothetical protein